MISIKYTYFARFWTDYTLDIVFMRLILALCLLETREQRGEPVKPGPGASKLEDKFPGPFDQTAGHKDDAVHHGLDPATGGLLKTQDFLHDHILRQYPEHVVSQHTHKQEGTVHLELAGMSGTQLNPSAGFHVHLGLELEVKPLAGSSHLLGPECFLVSKGLIKGSPDTEHFELGHKQKLSFFLEYFPDLKNKAHKFLKLLPECPGRRDAVYVRGELIIGNGFDVIKFGLALAQKTNRGSQDICGGYLGLPRVMAMAILSSSIILAISLKKTRPPAKPAGCPY